MGRFLLALRAACLLVLFARAGGSRALRHAPSSRTLRRLDAPTPWVRSFAALGNATGASVFDGVLAVDGTHALVVPHDALPRLAPVQTAFTVSMSVFLLDDPDVRHGYRALFWKGLAADDRTPSAWLVPGSNRITFRVSTTRAKEVWGTSAGAIPARRWAHVAFSLDADDRAMRLYVDGRLDAAAEIPGHAVANLGPAHVGRDPIREGPRAFIADVRMHPFALADADVAQMAAWALRDAPAFAREADADATRSAAARSEAARRAKDAAFREAMKMKENPPGDDEERGIERGIERGVEERGVEERGVEGGDSSSTPGSPGGGSGSDLESALARVRGELEAAAASSLAVALERAAASEREEKRGSPASAVDEERVEASFARARSAHFAAASAGSLASRVALADMYEFGYGGAADPAAATYHRLVAAGAGDPAAQLALGVAALLEEDEEGGDRRRGRGDDSGRAAKTCGTALHYLFRSATAAHEKSARPGGQARTERLRLFEGVEATRGDHRGAEDDRMVYLSHAAELGDARAMLAVGNAHYWGTFGLRRDFDAALRLYQRAHDAGALQGTVAVAKMMLKGEGSLEGDGAGAPSEERAGTRNLSKALAYYEDAANRSSSDALNGLGYLYFYGEPPVEKNETKALEYFRRAARLGNGDGLVNAGLMLKGGIGCHKNVTAAYEMFARCAGEPAPGGPPSKHASCAYQAALVEASGEAAPGTPRDCAKAAARFRDVAENGEWMRTLAEALVAHLAGDAAKARWLYDRSAANGAVVARFNAAFLHEMKEREARIASRGAERRRASGGGARENTSTRSRRHPTAAARRSANTLGMLLDRIASDPATGDEDLAWAAVTRGDRFFRDGAFRRALRQYVSASRRARASVDAEGAGGGDGSSEAAGSLLARALYSEASMRRFGIGCAADARRARDALWEAASDCGWRAALAATPPLLATLLLDALQAAADFDRAAADARRRGVFDGGPGAWLGRLPALVAGFVARALVGLGLLSFVWKLVVGPAARRVRAETLFRDRRPVPDRDRDGTRREGATSPGREAEGARGREEAEAGGGSEASDAAEDDAPAGAEEEEDDDGAADGDDFEEID